MQANLYYSNKVLYFMHTGGHSSQLIDRSETAFLKISANAVTLFMYECEDLHLVQNILSEVNQNEMLDCCVRQCSIASRIYLP